MIILEKTTSNKYPNIIILVLDAVRSRNLSCYGYERKTSPNLDEFGKKNVIYKNAIATSSWTLPSVSSIFTGLYPSEHNILNIKSRLTHQETIANKLNQIGYETVALSNVGWVTKYLGLNKGFDKFYEFDKYSLPKNKLLKYKELAKSTLSLRDHGAENANKMILHWFSNRKQNKPFFLYVHYVEPHFPYNPPRPFHTKFGRIYPWTLFINNHIKKKEFPKFYSGEWTITKKEWKIIHDLYDGEIAYLDKKVGELLTTFQNKDDNQLIFVTADHGECLSEKRDLPVLQHQFGLYDDLIKVPLLVKYPHQRNTVVKNQVQLSDIFGTIFEILSHKEVSNNRSLLQKEIDYEKSEFAISEYIPPKLILKRMNNSKIEDKYKQRRVSVRTNERKYIESKDLNEYFNLRMDPLEYRNLYEQLTEQDKEEFRNQINKVFTAMIKINKYGKFTINS